MALAFPCLIVLLAQPSYPRPELLAEPADLKTAKGAVLLDVRPRSQYLDGHVPGAVWVDVAGWSKAFGEGKDTQGWSKRIGALGIDMDTPVVVYDDSQSREAARVWWIMRYWGLKGARLLNGGWKGYMASGGSLEKEEASPKAKTVLLKPQANRLVTKDQLLRAVKEKPFQILDARSSDEFCGAANTAKRNGAVPGATHLEWTQTLDRKTGRFRSAEELTRLFKEAGIDPAKPATSYCQSGGRAAVLAFALELMGNKDVRNYYRSWAEWGNADDTPIVKPIPKK